MQGALVALVIALVYVFIWPGRRHPENMRRFPLWQRLVLRWFHSLTWILIAVACLIWSKFVAAAAGVVYLIFLFTSLRVRNAGPG
jgi:hypothetical protein